MQRQEGLACWPGCEKCTSGVIGMQLASDRVGRKESRTFGNRRWSREILSRSLWNAPLDLIFQLSTTQLRPVCGKSSFSMQSMEHTHLSSKSTEVTYQLPCHIINSNHKEMMSNPKKMWTQITKNGSIKYFREANLMSTGAVVDQENCIFYPCAKITQLPQHHHHHHQIEIKEKSNA